MSERDEHDAAADKLCAWWDNHGAESIDHLSELVAADRRAAVAETHGHMEYQKGRASKLDGQLDQERARTARLRQAAEFARDTLDNPVSTGMEAEAIDRLDAALADTPSDWLAEHDEKVRETRDALWQSRIAAASAASSGSENAEQCPTKHDAWELGFAAAFMQLQPGSLGGEGAK